MRKKGIAPMHADHVNVTPLIDVVMCLIIFFMVCGRLVQHETEGNVTVPEARKGQDLTDQRGRLVITLLPNEAVETPGNLSEPEKRLALGTVPPVMRIGAHVVQPGESLTELLKTAAKANPDLKVMVRADQVQEYKFVSPILVSCAYANIKSVNFSIRRLAE